MSAIEVIEQIKQLPPQEMEKVIAFVHAKTEDMALRDAPLVETEVRYMDRSRARELRERIFQDNDELFRKLAQ